MIRSISPEVLLRSLNSLETASENLTSGTTVADVMREILTIAVDILAADRAIIHFRDEDGTIPVVDSRNLSPEYLVRVSPHLTELTGILSPAAGQLFIVEQLRNDPRLEPLIDPEQKEQFCGLILAPLLYREIILGAIWLFYDRAHSLTLADYKVIQIFARQAGAILANTQLIAWLDKERTTTQQRADELAILNDIGIALSANLDRDEVLVATYKAIHLFLSSDLFYIALIANLEGDMVVTPIRVEGELVELNNPVQRTSELVQQIVRSGSTYLRCAPLATPDDGHAEKTEEPQGKTSLGVPLIRRDKVIGAICIEAQRMNAYSERELNFVQLVARQAAAALENAGLYSDLRRSMAQTYAAQAQVVEAARLAAIGELAANVTHELNNPLTTILGTISLMLNDDSLSQARRNQLETIAAETLRVRDITRSLTAFAQPSISKQDVTDINTIIGAALAVLQARLESQNIALIQHIEPELPLVRVDAQQIRQVFFNLILNAIEAMPDGGSLTISARGVRSKTSIEIAVTDTGVGIPTVNIPRLYEPFFSTKSDVKGVGLGLSVSHGIIREHSGTIRVDSTPGVGSTFYIALPAIPLPEA